MPYQPTLHAAEFKADISHWNPIEHVAGAEWTHRVSVNDSGVENIYVGAKSIQGTIYVRSEEVVSLLMMLQATSGSLPNMGVRLTYSLGPDVDGYLMKTFFPVIMFTGQGTRVYLPHTTEQDTIALHAIPWSSAIPSTDRKSLTEYVQTVQAVAAIPPVPDPDGGRSGFVRGG